MPAPVAPAPALALVRSERIFTGDVTQNVLSERTKICSGRYTCSGSVSEQDVPAPAPAPDTHIWLLEIMVWSGTLDPFNNSIINIIKYYHLVFSVDFGARVYVYNPVFLIALSVIHLLRCCGVFGARP